MHDRITCFYILYRCFRTEYKQFLLSENIGAEMYGKMNIMIAAFHTVSHFVFKSEKVKSSTW